MATTLPRRRDASGSHHAGPFDQRQLLIPGVIARPIRHRHPMATTARSVGTAFGGGPTSGSSGASETSRPVDNSETRFTGADALGGVTACCRPTAVGAGLAVA